MKQELSLRCLDDRRILDIGHISALTATDASGQFGLLPNHASLLTLLLPGLVVCRLKKEYLYLATSGGMLYCRDSRVDIVSTRFIQARDLHALMPALQVLKVEEVQIQSGRKLQEADLMHTLAKRLKEWQELK